MFNRAQEQKPSGVAVGIRHFAHKEQEAVVWSKPALGECRLQLSKENAHEYLASVIMSAIAGGAAVPGCEVALSSAFSAEERKIC